MSKILYRIAGKSLFVGYDSENENQVDFPWPIAEVLDFDNALVVRLDPQSDTRDNENIFGIDGNATILWQVPERQYIYDDSPYTGMKKAENRVHLYNWDGTELLVDPTTGEVVQETFGR